MPAENSYELEYISDITIIPLSHFQQIVDFLLKGTGLPHLRNAKNLDELSSQQQSLESDFAYIRGSWLQKERSVSQQQDCTISSWWELPVVERHF